MTFDYRKGAYWIGFCPLCGQEGQLIVMQRSAKGGLFLLCDECDCAWESPETVDAHTGFDCGDGPFTPATSTAIEQHGWQRYQPGRII